METFRLKILTLLLALTLSACKEEIPEHYPCLMVAKDQCLPHVLIDKENLIYKATDELIEMEPFIGGYCLRAGEFQKILQYIRNEKANGK